MADNFGLNVGEEGVKGVEVRVEERAHSRVRRHVGEGVKGSKGLVERSFVEIDRDLVDMMEGPNDVVDAGALLDEEGVEAGEVEGRDEVGFDANGQGEVLGVEKAETVGFGEVGVEDGGEGVGGEVGLVKGRKQGQGRKGRRRAEGRRGKTDLFRIEVLLAVPKKCSMGSLGLSVS